MFQLHCCKMRSTTKLNDKQVLNTKSNFTQDMREILILWEILIQMFWQLALGARRHVWIRVLGSEEKRGSDCGPTQTLPCVLRTRHWQAGRGPLRSLSSSVSPSLYSLFSLCPLKQLQEQWMEWGTVSMRRGFSIYFKIFNTYFR